jgi:hypothetical protein
VGPNEKEEVADMETSPRAKKSNSRQVLGMKEDRVLFARMLIVARSRPEIHLEDAIGNYECSVVPRALFAHVGVMLHCSKKSDLLQILEELPQRQTTAPDNDREQAISPDNDIEQATAPDKDMDKLPLQTTTGDKAPLHMMKWK